MSWSTPLPSLAPVADPTVAARLAADAGYESRNLPANAPDRYRVYAQVGEEARPFGVSGDETEALHMVRNAMRTVAGCFYAFQVDAQPEIQAARRIIMGRLAVIAIETTDGPGSPDGGVSAA